MFVVGHKAVRRWAVGAVFVVGCGPVTYLREVTRTATQSVEEARAAGAAKRSPYWWTRAVEYLHKAREEASRADFDAANRFGRLATHAAVRAKADAAAGSGSPPPPAGEAPSRGGIDAEVPGGLERRP